MREHMGVDQYGEIYHALGAHPRKTLLERLGRKRASKMYIDTKRGEAEHVGWIVAGRWVTVYKVQPLSV